MGVIMPGLGSSPGRGPERGHGQNHGVGNGARHGRLMPRRTPYETILRLAGDWSGGRDHIAGDRTMDLVV